jgi:hypothetical protein
VPATVTIPVGETSATFTVLGVDDGKPDGAQTVTIVASAAGFASGQASLEVRDGSAWQNPQNVFDVNGDGDITPLDVLLVISYVNGSVNGALPPVQPGSPPPPPFVDVNGDGVVTAQDVLWIINQINIQNGSGTGEEDAEGEPSAAETAPSASSAAQLVVASALVPVPAEVYVAPALWPATANAPPQVLYAPATVSTPVPAPAEKTAEETLVAGVRRRWQPASASDTVFAELGQQPDGELLPSFQSSCA